MRHPVKMTTSSWLTSLATSCWIAAAVFFLWAQGLLDRARLADLGVDLHEFPAQLLELAELSDLVFRFANGGGGGERLGDRLAFQLVGQAEIGTVAGVVGPMAVAVGFAAATAGGGDRPAT